MNMLSVVLLILIVCTSNMACFFIGSKLRQKVDKGETITLPSLDPMKAYRERQEKRKAEETQTKLDNVMHNIDVYDGTSRGQRDVG